MKKKLLTLALLPIFVMNVFGGNMAVLADELDSGEPTTQQTTVDETQAPTETSPSSNDDKADEDKPDETPPEETPSTGDTTPAETPSSGDEETPNGDTPITDGGTTDGETPTTDEETPTTDGETPTTDGEPTDTENPEVTETPDEQVASAPAMLGKASGDAICGEDAYIILYEDGSVVVQKGKDEESENIVTQYLLGTDDNPIYENGYHSQAKTFTVSNRLVGRTSLYKFFNGWTNLTSADVSNIDTSAVTNASSCFSGCSSLTSLDLSSWDTSKITDMSSLVSGCSSLKTLNMDNFDLSSANEGGSWLSGGFSGCSALTSVSAKNWDNLPAKMEHLWGRYWSMHGSNIPVDVSGWDLSTVTSLQGAFADASISSITGYSSWNTSNVTNMFQAFYNTPLTTIDLSGWDFSKVTDSAMMFNSTVTKITLPSGYAYKGNYGGENSNLSEAMWTNGSDVYKTSDLIHNFPGAGTYEVCSATAGVDAYAMQYADGTMVFQKGNTPDSAYGTLKRATLINTAPTKNGWGDYRWNLVDEFYGSVNKIIVKDYILGITSFEYFFAEGGFDPLTELVDFYKIDFSKVTSCSRMFGDKYGSAYTSLTTIDLSQCDLSNVSNFELMFGNNTQLETVIMPSLDGATTFKDMFYGCSNLKNTTLPFTNCPKLTTMYEMFRGCSSLEKVTDLSTWDVSKVTDGWGFCNMFCDCTSLTELDISGWNMPVNAASTAMLYGCTGLKKVVVGENFHSMAGSSSGSNIGGNLTGDWVNVSDNSMKFTLNQLLSSSYLPKYAGTYVPVNKVLTFHANGGTVNPTSISVTDDMTEVTFPTPNRDGYTFLGWFDSEDNKIEQYDPNSTVTDFYAKWDVADTYTLVIDSNREGLDNITKELALDENFYLSDAFASDSEYKITGYNTKADGTGTAYAVNDAVRGLGADGETVTLYAQWLKLEEITITVHYVNAMDGSTVYDDKTYTTTTGARFIEWYDGNYNQRYDDGNVIYFWSMLDWLDEQSAKTYFENLNGYPYDANDSWSYNYYSENDNPYKLIHQYNTVFTESCDVYAYVMPPVKFVVHYADFLTDQYENSDDIEVKFYDNWYKDGELTVTVPFRDGSWYASQANFTHDNFDSSFSIYMGGSNTKYTNSSVDGLTGNNEFRNGWETEFYAPYVYSQLFINDNPIDSETGNLDWTKQIGRCNYHSERVDRPDGTYYYTDVFDYDYRVPYGETRDIYLVLEVKLNYIYGVDGITDSCYCVIPGSSCSADITQYAISYLPNYNRQGYDLVKWVDADGKEYKEGDIIDLTTNNNLYAVWERNNEPLEPEDDPVVITDTKITVTFDSQGGTEFSPLTIKKYEYVGLGSYIPTLDGKVFVGWNTKADGTGTYLYRPNSNSATRFEEDTTVYAIWGTSGKIYFALDNIGSWRSNGRTSDWEYELNYRSITIIEGQQFGTLPGMYVNGQKFIGWFDADGNELTEDTVPELGKIYYPKYGGLIETVNENNINFECGAYWVNNSTEQVDDTHLYFDNGGVRNYANLHLTLNVLENSNEIPAGNIRIVIPKEFFSYNETNIGSELPEYPNTSSEMFFSYQVDGDNYVIVNTANLTNSSAGLNLTVIYGSQYTTWSTNNELPVKFEIDTDGDGVFETTREYNLCVKVASKSANTLNGISGKGTTYDVWQNSWGSAPEDANDYFYVLWTYTVSFRAPQQMYSTIYLYDQETNGGELVGYGQNGAGRGYEYATDNDGYQQLYVLYRYPLSSLDDNGRTTVNHQAKVIFDGTEHIVNAQAVDYRFLKLVRDEANFTIGRYNHYYPTVQSQNALMNDSTVTGLSWQAKYQNVSPSVWVTDENGENGHWITQEVNLWMGIGDVYMSSGAGDDYNSWNPACGNTILGEGDYEFTKLEIKLEAYDSPFSSDPDTAWTLKQLNRYANIPYQLWVRRVGDNDFLLYETGSTYNSSNWTTITLPANTVEWKIVVNTNGHYYNRVLVNPYMTILPSAKVKAQVESDMLKNATTVIKLGAHLDLNFDYDGMESESYVINHTFEDQNAVLDLYEIEALPDSELNLQLDVDSEGMTNDATNRVSNVEGWVGAVNYHENTQTPVTPIHQGIFYILLPEACPNPSQVWVYGSNNPQNARYYHGSLSWIDDDKFEYEFYTNWQGSNRTMMMVTVHDVNYSQIWVNFNTQRSYQDSILLGSQALMSGFFVNTEDSNQVYENIYGSYGSLNKAERPYYEELYNQYKSNYIAASATYMYYYSPTAESYGLFGSVARSNNSYASTVSVVPGENYSYKLYYGQSADTVASNIVIRDTLDGKGTLEDMYVPTISGYTKSGTATTSNGQVWYCTFENPDFDHLDIEHGWVTEMPKGTKVYGIVVDYSKDINGQDFVLGNGTTSKAFNVIIYEKADAIFTEETFSNTAVLYRDLKQNGVFSPESPSTNTTYASIHMPDIRTTLTSNPDSGTVDAPREVFKDDRIVYTLTVNNMETTALNNVVITDTLPSQVTISASDILVNGKPISDYSGKISYTIDGNKITVTIATLDGSSSNSHIYNIEIPCVVNEGTPDVVITNEGQVISFNNIDLPDEYIYHSNTTYHITGNVVPNPTGFRDVGTTTFVIIICIALAFMFNKLIYRRREEETT